MGENSTIEWTDNTFNPWMGCTKVSEGCKNCYAKVSHGDRFGIEWGPAGQRKKTSEAYWKAPIRWNKRAEKTGRKERVFCASLADVFDDHPSIQDEWRNQLLGLIHATPHLEWLLLTKRPENFKRFMTGSNPPLSNVRLGVSVENTPTANERLPVLCGEGLRGWKTFVSYEPALGPVNWDMWLDPEGMAGGTIGWVIAGGESGHGSRPAHPDWFRTCRDACSRSGVPFLFKQWGNWYPSESDDHPVYNKPHEHLGGPVWSYNLGKKSAGRLLDGTEHDGFPDFGDMK